jgi:hypothetical protein
MKIKPEDQAQLDELFAAFDELRVGGDDEPFWRLYAEFKARMPVAFHESLDRAFLDHLGKILEAAGWPRFGTSRSLKARTASWSFTGLIVRRSGSWPRGASWF